jgi:hypothetical protein
VSSETIKAVTAVYAVLVMMPRTDTKG